MNKIFSATSMISVRSTATVPRRGFLTAPKLTPNKEVTVEETKAGKFVNKVTANSHVLIADEPGSIEGGKDSGPSPYDLLLASLGTCTSMTIRMYADRRQLPLEKIRVQLTHEKVHSKDIEGLVQNQEKPDLKVDKIVRNIELVGKYLTDEQKSKMLDIANKCPVHQTLSGTAYIQTKLQ